MHDEDNKLGLKVKNANGATWTAYGDSYFFDAANAQNRMMLEQAVNASIKEIDDCYNTGTLIVEASMMGLLIAPKSVEPPSHYPMFQLVTLPLSKVELEQAISQMPKGKSSKLISQGLNLL